MVKNPGAIDLHEFCSKIEDQDLGKTFNNLEKVLEQNTKCWLEQMYVPKQNNHRHAVIAIAGFCSQDADLKNVVWLQLTNFCRVRNIPLFVLRWESKDETFFNEVGL